MSKKVILSHALLLALLVACAPKTQSPYELLRNCRAPSDAEANCTPTDSPGGYGEIRDSTRLITIPPSTGEMVAIYETERAIVFVNRDKYVATGYAPTLIIEDSREHGYMEPRYKFMVDSIGSSNLAVYDKLKKSCVTSLKKRTYEYNCGHLCGKGFIIIYLPDCTKLFQVLDWVS